MRPEIGADRGKIRGGALRGFVSWYGSERGSDVLGGAVAALPPGEQRLFDLARPDLGLSPSRWYPVGAIHRVLDGLTNDLDAAQAENLARRGAERIMEDNLRGFLRTLFRLFVSPAVCAAFSQTLWDTHYDTGRVQIDDLGRGAHRMRVSSWRGHHPFLCRLNNAAGVPIYRSAGCSGVTTDREACVDRGDPFCEYMIRWRG